MEHSSWFILTMSEAANDNSEPWTSIGLAAALILVKLRTKQAIDYPAERAERRSETGQDRCESHSVDNVSDDAAQRFSCAT